MTSEDTDIDSWCRYLRAAGRPSTTIRTRRDHLRMLARAYKPRSLTQLDLDDLTNWMGEQPWADETRRSVRSSLRMFYQWAVSTHRITESPAEHLPKIKQSQPAPKPVPEPGLIEALANAAPRERLMLRLGCEIGLRRGEVARVHTRDLFPDLTGWSLRVRGKGGKIREVPLPADLADALRQMPSGYVFPGNDHGHLSPGWIGVLVKRLLPPGYTMHSLRHRFATKGYEAKRDLLAMQALLGHASPQTTRAYIRVSSAASRAIVEAVAA